MTILKDATPIAIICTRDVAATAAFYRDTLGFTPVTQDAYAAVFRVGGIDLRVSLVPDFTPSGHTTLSFHVEDVSAVVVALAAKGVVFHRASHLTLDASGIWNIPGGRGRVAWLADPEGNLLSLTSL